MEKLKNIYLILFPVITCFIYIKLYHSIYIIIFWEILIPLSKIFIIYFKISQIVPFENIIRFKIDSTIWSQALHELLLFT